MQEYLYEYGVINYYSFVAASIAIILLPGPNSLYVLTTSGKYGVRSGFFCAAAVFIGDMLLMLSVALGAHTILHRYPLLMSILQFTGGIYIAYLGLKILFDVYKNIKIYNDVNIIINNNSESIEIINIEQNITGMQHFFKALYISLLNPKALLFFMAFFMQFISPTSSNIAMPFALLGITLQIISLSYLSLIIFAGRHLSNYFKERLMLKNIASLFIGLLFICFGLKMLI
jgi:leucine efflux protein